MSVHLVVLAPDEVRIKADRLKELEAKERAHDQYLHAMRRMRIIAGDMAHETDYEKGFFACLNKFAEMIVEAGWQS